MPISATTPAPPPSPRPCGKVLAQRAGVCQDFAHLAIGCLRSLGLAARYVSGYLLHRPAARQAAPGRRRRLARLVLRLLPRLRLDRRRSHQQPGAGPTTTSPSPGAATTTTSAPSRASSSAAAPTRSASPWTSPRWMRERSVILSFHLTLHSFHCLTTPLPDTSPTPARQDHPVAWQRPLRPATLNAVPHLPSGCHDAFSAAGESAVRPRRQWPGRCCGPCR